MNNNHGLSSNFPQSNTLFITGKIGNKEIAKEDLNTFLSSIKDFEWTDNNIYKSAKVCEVKPTFVQIQNTNSPVFQQKNVNFDLFYVDKNSHLENFMQYKSDIENRRTQIQDKIIHKNKEFIENYLQGENLSENPDKKELLEAIKKNKLKIIQNSNLNSKLSRYIGYLSQQQMQLNSNMMESIKEEKESFGNKSEKEPSFINNIRRFSDISQLNQANRLSAIQQGARRTIRNSGMEAK